MKVQMIVRAASTASASAEGGAKTLLCDGHLPRSLNIVSCPTLEGEPIAYMIT